MATQKAQYLGQMQSAMTELAALNTRMETLAAAFVARGYDAAANDPVTLTDLDDFGVIVYDMGIAVNICQSVNALCKGEAVAANVAIPVSLSKWRVL